ncbi:MAG TPA: hypothetical protein VKR32_10705 [Puia sp.]|nr:hypothetical protein [Puia sp.]
MRVNQFKIAPRSLLKNSSTNLINIFGVAIGMTAAVFILMIRNEFSFDRYQLLANKRLENLTYRIHIGSCIFIVASCDALAIARASVGFQAIKAALANPVRSRRIE